MKRVLMMLVFACAVCLRPPHRRRAGLAPQRNTRAPPVRQDSPETVRRPSAQAKPAAQAPTPGRAVDVPPQERPQFSRPAGEDAVNVRLDVVITYQVGNAASREALGDP